MRLLTILKIVAADATVESSYVYFPADVTDSGVLNRVIEESFERFPALHTVLGHAAGSIKMRPLALSL